MVAKIPKHVGVIMDGNGRWGKARGLTRSEGHYAGSEAMEKVIDASIAIGIEALTLYAFSSENWSRSKQEVNYLMRLPVRFFNQKISEFMRRNIKVLVSGDLDGVPKATRRVLLQAIDETKNNTGLIANFAFNYGGRNEILRATHLAIKEAQENNLEITESLISKHLSTNGLPELDLIIRTGGEQRLSNFLLWQSAEADLYFTDIYFPDFDETDMEQAIAAYQKRKAMGEFPEVYRRAK